MALCPAQVSDHPLRNCGLSALWSYAATVIKRELRPLTTVSTGETLLILLLESFLSLSRG